MERAMEMQREETRAEKLLRACTIVKKQDEGETELMTMLARSMQLGYDIGRMERKEETAARGA